VPRVCVITEGRDKLAEAVVSALRSRGISSLTLEIQRLCHCQLYLDADSCTVDGFRVGGVLFRASPEASWSEGFAADDRLYCDAELRAAWLAILHLDSVLAINQWDAMMWFEGGEWPTWRRLLIGNGVPVSPFSFGGMDGLGGSHSPHWYPYRFGERSPVPGPASQRVLGAPLTVATERHDSLVACGHVLTGQSARIESAVQVLASAGLRLASIVTDDEGRVLRVNPRPMPKEPELLSRTASLLTEVYARHLRAW
jgi:hypothetical protein